MSEKRANNIGWISLAFLAIVDSLFIVTWEVNCEFFNCNKNWVAAFMIFNIISIIIYSWILIKIITKKKPTSQ